MTRQVLVQDTTIESLLEQINSSIETTIELVLDRKSKQPILDKEWCTIKEVCSLFDVTKATVHLWIRKGKLTKYKLGSRSTRFKTDEVRTLLKLIERKRN